MIEPLEINGEPPAIQGTVLEELHCQQYWYRGELKQEANVIFLRCNGIWHRLYFDFGIIFWRRDEAAPKSYEAPEVEGSHPVVDTGRELLLTGLVVESCEMTAIQGGSQVKLQFVKGRQLLIQNIGDRTRLAG